MSKAIENSLVVLTRGVLETSNTWIQYVTQGSGNPLYAFAAIYMMIFILYLCIGLWFPKFGNKYSQSSPSMFSKNLIYLTRYIVQVLTFLGPLYLFGFSFWSIGAAIPSGSYVAIAYNTWRIIMLNLLLAFLTWIFQAFTKFDYSKNVSSIFYYCTIDPTSNNNLDANPATCKRTKHQTLRDAFLQSVATYTSALQLNFISDTNVYLIPFLILGGIILGVLHHGER